MPMIKKGQPRALQKEMSSRKTESLHRCSDWWHRQLSRGPFILRQFLQQHLTWSALPYWEVPCREPPAARARGALSYSTNATGKSGVLGGLVVVGVCRPCVSSFTRSDR